MTEADWLAFTSPYAMVEAVRGTAGDRKLRLYACACARTAYAAVSERRRRAIEAAEEAAEGEAPAASLAAHRGAGMGVAAGSAATAAREAVRAARIVARRLSRPSPGWGPDSPLDPLWDEEPPPATDAMLCHLARCVLDPFSAAPPRPPWRTHDVMQVARAALAERVTPEGALDPLRLNVLADALTDAGCADERLLAHLRSPGPHVRGCWAVDLALGRAR